LVIVLFWSHIEVILLLLAIVLAEDVIYEALLLLVKIVFKQLLSSNTPSSIPRLLVLFCLDLISVILEDHAS